MARVSVSREGGVVVRIAVRTVWCGMRGSEPRQPKNTECIARARAISDARWGGRFRHDVEGTRSDGLLVGSEKLAMKIQRHMREVKGIPRGRPPPSPKGSGERRESTAGKDSF